MNEVGYLLAFLCGSTVIYAVWNMVKDAKNDVSQNTMPVLPYVAEQKTQEQTLADNLDKALKFESFVTSKFNPAYFVLLDWRSDKSYQGVFPLSSLYPDLKYEFVPNGIRFAVECKWRNSFYKDAVDTTPDQLIRYHKYQQHFDEKVFLVIGVGGIPEIAESVYIVPLSDINPATTSLSRGFLENYRRTRSGDFYFDPRFLQLK